MRKLLLTLGLVASLLAVAFPAQSATALFPNLRALPASDLHLATDAGITYLQFSATNANDGVGPLELIAGEIGGGSRDVSQRTYNDDGTFTDRLAGTFEWHADHNHFHFEDFALYTLQPVNAPGAAQRTSSKTTFCVMDTDRYNTKLPGAPKRPVYNRCDRDIQGMSVGWADTYGYYLAGQAIAVTQSGDYRLTIEVDPKNQLVELSDLDNQSEVLVRIDLQAGTVTRLDGNANPGRGRGRP